MSATTAADEASPAGVPRGELIIRHRISTRLWHWLNVVAVITLIMSGLMISNAHPMLYWGEFGANLDTPWLRLPRFPGWATIPSNYDLALGRLWHLAFAWVFSASFTVYLVWSLVNRHWQRDITLSRDEVSPALLWQNVKKHARLDFRETTPGYNPLQKITYILVLFGLIPGLIFTGLAMSPGFDAATHISAVFGGRQSARSLHFVFMAGMVAFIIVHIVLVFLAGPINEMRSMITGRFRLAARKAGR